MVKHISHEIMVMYLGQCVEYAKTEDALFVLSLFDDQEEGYRTMHSQLLRLLGKERTLSLPENCGVLEWLVQHYAPYIKSYRGKSDLVLRTLRSFSE